MKLQILSDVHLEMHAEFIRTWIPPAPTFLVLAGDITIAPRLPGVGERVQTAGAEVPAHHLCVGKPREQWEATAGPGRAPPYGERQRGLGRRPRRRWICRHAGRCVGVRGRVTRESFRCIWRQLQVPLRERIHEVSPQPATQRDSPEASVRLDVARSGERLGTIRAGASPIRYMLGMDPGLTTAADASLTVREAADLLQVNTKTVHLLLAQGLPHQRLGKRVIRIRREDLLAFGRVE